MTNTPLPEERDAAPRGRMPTFVIVLWLESASPPDRPEWRWRVTRVDTNERHYFNRLADLLAYVSTETGVEAPG